MTLITAELASRPSSGQSTTRSVSTSDLLLDGYTELVITQTALAA